MYTYNVNDILMLLPYITYVYYMYTYNVNDNDTISFATLVQMNIQTNLVYKIILYNIIIL